MPKENQDRDAIVSKAIGIASEEERADYVARACNSNAELKHQVEEQIAAHFRADSPSPEQAGEEHKETKAPEPTKEKLAHARQEVRTVAHEHPRFMTVSAILLVFLFVAAVGGAGLAVWEWREKKQAQRAEQQAVENQQKAEKEAKKAKGKLKRAEADAKERIRERDQAQEAEKTAKRSEEELKAIQSFLKDKLLSVGRPGDVSISMAFWSGTKGADVTARKGITLRQAVDEAESKVAEMFADRPLAEATLREMLGFSYLNLGEATRAVQQYEQAFELRQAVQGDSASETADCRNQLAVAYRLAGRDTEASRLFHRYPESPTHASALVVRGLMLLAQKKPAEAELKLRESLTIRRKIQPDEWTTFETKSILGQALLEQKKYAEAEPLLLSGYQGMNKRASQIRSQDKGQLTQALERLVHLYDAWGKKEKAAQWRKELEKANAAKKS